MAAVSGADDLPRAALLTGIVAEEDAVEACNRGCFCITLSKTALRQALLAELADSGLPPLLDSHPHFFAAAPVFVSRRHVAQMGEIIRAIETVVRTEGYLEAIRAWTPQIAGSDPGARGVFFGYDFHLGPDRLQLIEINTNAGGALFNAHLARAQEACCQAVAEALVPIVAPAAFEAAVLAMFCDEWQLQRPNQELQRVAIVDSNPSEQIMYPEFVLFKQLFQRRGIATEIVDPQELSFADGALRAGADIDLVYNRLVDFYFSSPDHEAMAAAYRSGAVVVTPHPHAYAVYADKRNLTLLSDDELLASWGVDSETREALTAGIPATERVSAENAGDLWSRRRQLFFKPPTGHGSRGTYRGAKLTRRVWQSIVAGDYIAQDLVPPSERTILIEDQMAKLKADLRAYVYNGKIQFVAARLYRGQTTNMRTPGGGFAPVFTEA